MRLSRAVLYFYFVWVIFATLAVAQQAQPVDPPPLRNHHILLVPASAPGTGEPYWIAVAPDGQLAIFPVSELKTKMAEGCRPFTFGEFQDALATLMNQNASLSAELKRVQASQTSEDNTPSYARPVQSPSAAQSSPTAAMQAAAAQADAQRREQQRRQAMLMFLMGQQGQKINMNVNVTDCTKFPALCVNH